MDNSRNSILTTEEEYFKHCSAHPIPDAKKQANLPIESKYLDCSLNQNFQALASLGAATGKICMYGLGAWDDRVVKRDIAEDLHRENQRITIIDNLVNMDMDIARETFIQRINISPRVIEQDPPKKIKARLLYAEFQAKKLKKDSGNASLVRDVPKRGAKGDVPEKIPKRYEGLYKLSKLFLNDEMLGALLDPEYVSRILIGCGYCNLKDTFENCHRLAWWEVTHRKPPVLTYTEIAYLSGLSLAEIKGLLREKTRNWYERIIKKDDKISWLWAIVHRGRIPPASLISESTERELSEKEIERFDDIAGISQRCERGVGEEQIPREHFKILYRYKPSTLVSLYKIITGFPKCLVSNDIYTTIMTFELSIGKFIGRRRLVGKRRLQPDYKRSLKKRYPNLAPSGKRGVVIKSIDVEEVDEDPYFLVRYIAKDIDNRDDTICGALGKLSLKDPEVTFWKHNLFGFDL